MKKILVVIMCLVMLFGMLPICASGEVSEADIQAEQTEELSESEQINKAISIFVLVGAVIGAALAITALYKKKDELRYL